MWVNKKVWKFLIYVLVVAMLLPVTVPSCKIYAATETKVDLENENVADNSLRIVYSYKELVQAMNEVGNGDIVGIASNIEIDSDVNVVGCDDKRITIMKMFEGAFIQVNYNADVKFKNVIFDGNSSIYNQEYTPMIQAYGKTTFENVTFQNCCNNWSGGAVRASGCEMDIIRCHFKNNQANEGGHLVVSSSAKVKAVDSLFENGVAIAGGGVVKIEEQYSSDGTINSIDFAGCKMVGNQARYGGAIANKGNVKITNSIIYGNNAETAADIINYSNSSFEIDSLEELTELYSVDGVRPLAWEFDYIDRAYICGDIDKDNPFSAMKLKYEKIGQENDEVTDNPNDNTEVTDNPSNNDDTKDKSPTENNDNENESNSKK